MREERHDRAYFLPNRLVKKGSSHSDTTVPRVRWRQIEIDHLQSETSSRLLHVRGVDHLVSHDCSVCINIAVPSDLGAAHNGELHARSSSDSPDASPRLPVRTWQHGSSASAAAAGAPAWDPGSPSTSWTLGPRTAGEHAKPTATEEFWYAFWGPEARELRVKIRTTGSEMRKHWPNAILHRLQVDLLDVVHIDGPQHVRDYEGVSGARDIFRLTHLQQDILDQFIKSVRVERSQTMSTLSLAKRKMHSEQAKAKPLPLELLDAAVEVMVELCAVVVCAMNGAYPDSDWQVKEAASSHRRAKARHVITYTLDEIKAAAEDSVPNHRVSSVKRRKARHSASYSPGASFKTMKHSKSMPDLQHLQPRSSTKGRVRIRLASSRVAATAAGEDDEFEDGGPTQLDPTPWDGWTHAAESWPLWQAVARQNKREVQAELQKIKNTSSDLTFLSRVLEHRRRFRYPGNPKPLTGTVLFLALQEFEQTASGAEVSTSISAEICDLLVQHGADPEAFYKCEECGKNKNAMVFAPLCFAARNKRTLELFHKWGVSFGQKSRCNYHSHGTVLWQAAWMRDADMVKFLLKPPGLGKGSYDYVANQHLYEVTNEQGRKLEKIVQYVGSLDEARRNRAEASKLHGSPLYPQVFREGKNWKLEYTYPHRNQHIQLSVPMEIRRFAPLADSRYAGCCFFYNRHIRDPKKYRKCPHTADSCLRKHKRIPDKEFNAIKWDNDAHTRPPISGWALVGDAFEAQTSGAAGAIHMGAYHLQSTHMAKGWHPDFPPPFESNYGHRCTPLGLAILHHMDCARDLMQYGFQIREFELNAAVALACPQEFKDIFMESAKTSPEMLLRMPRPTILKSHPMLLEGIWKTLKDDKQAKEKLQMAVKDIMRECPNKKSKDVEADKEKMEQALDIKRMITDLIRNAPNAAKVMLDNFFLQAPEVTSTNRNPVAMHALVDPRTKVNTAYVKEPEWSYDFHNMAPPTWQCLLTGVKYEGSFVCQPDANSYVDERQRWSKRWNPWDPPYQNQFCDVRVAYFRGILSLDIFRAISDLRYNQQVELLAECTTLQAVVCHTWRKWAHSCFRLWLAEDIIQFVAVVGWGISEARGSLIHIMCWLLFSVIALGRLFHDVGMVFMATLYLAAAGMRERKSIRWVDIFNWWRVPFHVLSFYLFWTGWATSISHDIQDKEVYLFWLGIGVVWKAFDIAFRLHSSSLVGQLLIPIMDVFRDGHMLAMLCVMGSAVTVVFVFVYIVWNGALEEQLMESSVNTWVNLVVGEPVMLVANAEGEFDRAGSNYPLIAGAHLGFTVVLMNVLMAMTMRIYTNMSEQARGRLFRAQSALCRELLWKRRVLLTLFCNFLGLNANKAIFFMVVAVVVSASCVLLATEVPVITTGLVCGGVAEMVLTLFVMLHDTPIKPQQTAAMWWIERNYLWVCVPRYDEIEKALREPREAEDPQQEPDVADYAEDEAEDERRESHEKPFAKKYPSEMRRVATDPHSMNPGRTPVRSTSDGGRASSKSIISFDGTPQAQQDLTGMVQTLMTQVSALQRQVERLGGAAPTANVLPSTPNVAATPRNLEGSGSGSNLPAVHERRTLENEEDDDVEDEDERGAPIGHAISVPATLHSFPKADGEHGRNTSPVLLS